MFDEYKVIFVRVGLYEMIEACDEILDWIETWGEDVLDGSENCSRASVVGFGLSSGVGGATRSDCWGRGDLLFFSLSCDTVRGLLRISGSSRTASETGRGVGVGRVIEDVAISSERGLESRVGIVCADSELSLLCVKVDDGDVIEPLGLFSEERCEASDVLSGSLDPFRCFPKGALIR